MPSSNMRRRDLEFMLTTCADVLTREVYIQSGFRTPPINDGNSVNKLIFRPTCR
jgi:hypothetical protein